MLYKILMCMYMGLALSQSTYALELSEPTINAGLELGFPRTIKGIEISSPISHFEEGRAELCATAKTKLINKPIDFCTKFEPVWDATNSQLNARKIELTKISTNGLSFQTS